MVYLPHAFGIGTDASPRSIAFGNTAASAQRSSKQALTGVIYTAFSSYMYYACSALL